MQRSLRAVDTRSRAAMKTELFISHASEDKDEVARPLAEELTRLGFRVWYDEYSLRLVDSLREKIDEGLANCTYGLTRPGAEQWPEVLVHPFIDLAGIRRPTLPERDAKARGNARPNTHHIAKSPGPVGECQRAAEDLLVGGILFAPLGIASCTTLPEPLDTNGAKDRQQRGAKRSDHRSPDGIDRHLMQAHLAEPLGMGAICRVGRAVAEAARAFFPHHADLVLSQEVLEVRAWLHRYQQDHPRRRRDEPPIVQQLAKT